MFNWTYVLFGYNYKVATLSTFYLTVLEIIIPTLPFRLRSLRNHVYSKNISKKKVNKIFRILMYNLLFYFFGLHYIIMAHYTFLNLKNFIIQKKMLTTAFKKLLSSAAKKTQLTNILQSLYLLVIN